MFAKYTYYTVAALTIGALVTPLTATDSSEAAAPSNSIEKPATPNKKRANADTADTTTTDDATNTDDATTNAATKPHLNRGEILTHIEAIVKTLPYVSEGIAKKLHTAGEGEKLSDETLTELVSSVLNLARPKPTDSQEATEHYKALKTAEGLLIKRLKSYRITGFSFTVDPNGAFIWDNQDPAFTVTYTNAKGETKSRKYQASIDSIGLKFEFAIKLDLIFITGTDANFYSTNQVIELGTGVEVNGGPLLRLLMRQPRNWNLHGGETLNEYANYVNNFETPLETQIKRFLGNMSLLYVPFRNVSGGLLILGLAVGPFFLNGACSDFYYGDLSMVTGGKLTPVD